jgi:hypothetical protein
MTKRESFASTLRSRTPKLPSPTGYGFDEQVWRDAFQVLNDHSPTDKNLFMLGLVLGHQSRRITSSVDHLSSLVRFRPLSELAPHFSRRINDVHRMAVKSWGDALQQVDCISYEQTGEMRCFVDAAGNAYSLQSPIEAVVDAICNAIKMLARSDGLGKLTPDAAERMDIRDALGNLMDLAQHSLSVQRVWNSVIWLQSTAQVDPHSGNYAVDETQSDLARRSTIDLTRRPIFMMRSFQKLASDDLEENTFIPKVVFDGMRLSVHAASGISLPTGDRTQLFETRRSQGILQEGALSDFIELAHPETGMTIAEILTIWGELAVIAFQLQTMAESLDVEKDRSALKIILASQFRRTDLVTALTGCVRLSREKIAACLEFLCFKPSKGPTLWDRPLLGANEDVCLLWWPLLGVYHARLLSAWAKTDKTLAQAFEKKGARNQNMLVEEIVSAISRSPYRDRIRYIGSGLRPRHKPDEEIDMLIVVDDTAFVIELASIPCPAEPYEFGETERRLDQKADQCRDQCKALAQDLAQIDDWNKGRGQQPPVTSVTGVVMTNSYLRDGTYEDDISYCHWETLLNILRYGGLYFGIMRGDQEQTLMAPIKAGPNESLATVLKAALKKSPKAEFYARSLGHADLHLKGFDASDRQGIYRAWNVEFPSPREIEEHLRQCSFGPTLELVDNPDFS